MRLAARDIVRRKPADFENILLQLMTGAPESVRRVISRSVGQTGFDHFWEKFYWMEKSTRKAAGRAMLKVLPDAVQRLSRKLTGGALSERLKAIQVTHELGLTEQMRPVLTQLCNDTNPRLRSKAVTVLGELPAATDAVLDRVLQDADPRAPTPSKFWKRSKRRSICRCSPSGRGPLRAGSVPMPSRRCITCV